jgi:hypothetical protein
MIFPRFTIRWLLALMAVVGVLSLVSTSAVRVMWNVAEREAGTAAAGMRRYQEGEATVVGDLWTVAFCAGVLALALVFCLFAAVFLAASPLTLLDGALRGRRQPTTPFATAQPPPQILPPEEPE